MADVMNIAEAAHEWLTYAENDLGSAEYLLGRQPLPVEIICFHCQQAAEKVLKGILVLNNIDPPKIHNLIELHNLCKAFVPAIAPFVVQCEALNRYSVGTRYPNELAVTKTKMQQALVDAKAIMDFARPLFPKYEQVILQ